MAKLHRGVFGLPHRAALMRGVVCLLSSALLVATPTSAQDDLSVDDIERWAADLRGDAAERRSAFEHLSTLPASALPAIQERITRTRRQIVPAEDGYDALRSFRHATGSRRADDMVDLAAGILAVLEERRTPVVGRTAERVLLLRSLEAIGTVEAQRRIADIFSLTNGMWRWEQRRLVDRMGVQLLPGLIVARGHDDRGVRLWARGHIRNMGMKEPANALRVEEPELLAQVIAAYAEVKDLDTMPIILSYVGHPDRRIREAARAAFESFGRNGIWQLREGIRKQLGASADSRWGWRRTMRELWDGLDQQRLAPYAVRVDEAQAALETGEHTRAREILDALVRDVAQPPRVQDVASAYATLASELAEPQLLRRAIWLAPEAPDVERWRGQLIWIEAEIDREAGVVDADAYRQALSTAPSEEVRDVAAEVLGEDEAEAVTSERTEDAGAGLTALGLLFMLIAAGALGVGAWRSSRSRQARPTQTPVRPMVAMMRALMRVRWLAPSKARRPRTRAKKVGKPRAIDAGMIFGDAPKSEVGTIRQMPHEAGETFQSGAPLALGHESIDAESEVNGIDDVTEPGIDDVTEPGIDDVTEPEPGIDDLSGLGGLLLAKPEDVDTLPGVPAP